MFCENRSWLVINFFKNYHILRGGYSPPKAALGGTPSSTLPLRARGRAGLCFKSFARFAQLRLSACKYTKSFELKVFNKTTAKEFCCQLLTLASAMARRVRGCNTIPLLECARSSARVSMNTKARF